MGISDVAVILDKIYQTDAWEQPHGLLDIMTPTEKTIKWGRVLNVNFLPELGPEASMLLGRPAQQKIVYVDSEE